MAGPSKRTRTATQDEENAPPTPPPTARATRRTTAPSTTTTPPSPSTTTPSRPIQTRSSTLHLAPPTPLTRTSSLYTPTTRRTSPSSLSLTSITPSSDSSTAGPSRGGMLIRTQSTPALTNPSDLKEGITSGSGGPGRGKGDPEDLFGLGPGGRRFGKGKENVPPKKEDDAENSSRKRLRVGSRASGSGSGSANGLSRARSGSVASVRSESSSGPSLFSRRPSVFPSPSPSPSNVDSSSSVDPLDLIRDDMDVDKTPTKSRPSIRRNATLPTPPSSSPTLIAEVDATGKRMSLFRMDSTLSTCTTATEVDDSPSVEEGIPMRAKNAYKHLKSFLRLSQTTAKSTSADVVGREDEKAVLSSYFSLRSAYDVGMYVSGPPGTGKTALVTAMGRELALEGWNVIEVGCMGVRIGDIWTQLAEQFGCDRNEQAVQAAVAQMGKNTLIVLDEVDSLLPPAPAMPTPATSHLLSRLFSLPLLSTPSMTIKFIAISNTLDLTVRARLVLPTGTQPQVLPFKAYGTTEMISIVNSRIALAAIDRSETETAKVDLKAIELLTRKVEAQNGDLRMCLASLTSAVNLAEVEWVKKTFTAESDNSLTIPLVKISLPHIIKAFTSHTQQLKAAAGSGSSTGGSPTSRKIRSVPLQGKMVLVSVLIYLSRCRVGLPGCPTASSSSSTPTTSPSKHGDLTTSSLYATYTYILSHTSSPFPPAPESDYRDLLSNLETLGLVSLFGNSASMSRSTSAGGSRAKGSNGPRVELCVPEEDVKLGLGVIGAIKGGMADEEVGKVWEREEARVIKAREKIARAVDVLAGIERDT